MPGIAPATEEDFDTEYDDYVVSCKVVSDVYSSSKPISPNIPKTAMMAAALAFLCVCALVVLQELFHDYIVDDADMERKLGITALGVIPDVEV